MIAFDEAAGTEARVINAVRDYLRSTDRNLDGHTRFVDDLGADSLALVELTLVFEETFDIDIPDEEAEQIRTIRDAIVSVEKGLRARSRV